jgi:type I restriction enzyme S subunit
LHYFKTPQGKDLLELASPGGAGRNKTLGQKEFERLKLPIPPAKEQARIVLILDTWEQAIRTMKELLLTARQEKQAHMRQMLTPHHPADWKKNGWRRAPLAEIVAVDSESLSSVTPPDFKFRYISLADVNEGRISNSLPLHNFRTAPSRARRIVHPGDILMSTVRPNLKGYARVAEPQRECIASTGFAVLSSRHGTNINYVYHYLLSDDIQHQLNSLVAGSNYPAISSAEVADLQINIPVHELQVQIVKLLDMLDGRISAIATQVKMLESEKTALTQCLFSGRRRVTPCVRNAGAHA